MGRKGKRIMNKLFTKIATLSVGLALAVGVGVAVGQKSAVRAKASEAVLMSCDMTAKTTGTTGYSKEHTYGDYKIYGGQNNNNGWEYFKFGAKKANKTDPDKVTEGYIKSTKASTEIVTKIEVSTLASSVSCDVTWDVKVASDSDFGNLIDTTAAVTLDRSTAGSSFMEPTSGKTWASGSYFWVELHITNHSTTNGCLFLAKVNFYYESSTPRGEVAPNDLDTSVFEVGDSKSLSYQWTPAQGSSATITSHSWSSSDTDVATVSGDTCTAVGAGVFTLTLNATDSNSEAYVVQTRKYFVTNEYAFEVGDLVAVYSEGAGFELSDINKSGSTHYGEGTAYSASPSGLYPLTVEAGSESGSFAFVKDGNYLSWTSGNSLSTKATKDANSSWYVVIYDTYTVILNAAQNSREIWWNSGSPRFACYEGKTPTSAGYNSVSLIKIESVPVRGTISISTEFENPMREGATVNAQYSWTPAEGDDATIVSATWSSSDTAVFSVTGSTVEAVGAGKAKITLNATDSNGEEYVVSTSDITVVGVVSGSYEKKYSVSVGDTVAIVCEAEGTQFSGLNGKIGDYLFYNDAPASVYDFILEAGTAEDSFALVDPDGKYLRCSNNTKAEMSLAEEKDENSSWTIEIDGEGNASITNVGLDGEAHRYIAWNHGSPRFAPYKSGQTAVQLYGPAIVLDSSAIAFAQKIIDDITCDSDGKVAPSTSAWEALEEELKDVTAEGKEQLKIIHAIAHEDPATDREIVEEALAKYDYIVGKYGTSRYNDFLLREPSPISSGAFTGFETSIDSNNTMIIVIAIAATSAIALGALLLLKKRKQK